jgi:transposase
MDSQGQVLANRSVGNDWRAMRTVVLGTVPEGRSVVVKASIECCSGAAHLAEELMERAEWSVTLAHPGLVNRMKQNPEKSDHADAIILADLMRLGYLPKVWLAPREIRQLRALVRYRHQQVQEQTRLKLRIHAMLREHRIPRPQGVGTWSMAWMAWLQRIELDDVSRFLMDEFMNGLQRVQQKVRELERTLKKLTENDALVAKLLSIDGVGPITAITMRAEIARFDRFDSGKQLARYSGTSPRNASSGQRQADAGLVKAGNPHLRRVIIQAAQRLVNHDKRWGAFAARKLREGKPRNVVVAAVANRWIRKLYHQMQPEQLAAV